MPRFSGVTAGMGRSTDMCGIFGLIALPGHPAPSRQIVERGIALLRHRGPDGSGILCDGPVCLGHARLAIVDVAAGTQPMAVEGKAALSFNGEIYNHAQLRPELERRGHRFATRSDSETLLHACMEWGASALGRLRGMFAFAFWDVERDRVLLARDRVGKKPLFYTVGPHGLAFSSELEALWQTLGPWPLSPEALDQYLCWQYVPAPNTIYRGVHCLPPGHVLEVCLKTGAITCRAYWEVVFKEDRSLSVAEWDRAIDAKIHESVAIRLMSDVPFGAFLSGGIDSSLVVSHMAELLDRPVETFSIGYAEAQYSELPFAEAAARVCRTNHHGVILDAGALDILPQLVRHFGQPFADSSAIPTWHVAALARQSVKMVLSGDGGDEVFAGYNTYERVIREATPHLGRGIGGWLLGRLLSPVLRKSAAELAALQGAAYRHFAMDERRDLVRSPWSAGLADQTIERRAILERRDIPLLSRLQMVDMATYLPFDILTKVDIAAMGNSLEVRAPLLDHELIELAATLPVEQRLTAGRTSCEKKRLLKRLALARLPAQIIDRPKMGFGLPLGPWLEGRMAAVRSRLRASGALAEVMHMERVEAILAAHTATHDLSAKIWNILVLTEWLDTHSEALTTTS